MAKKYRVKEVSLLQYPTLSTQINGSPISLNGKETKFSRQVTPGGPVIEMIARPASQAQLKQLFEEGNPHIEEIEDNAPEVSGAKA